MGAGKNSILDSLAHGAGQGATAGFSDELVSRILANLPMSDDGTGIPREYAAGSEQADLQNSLRSGDAAAAADHPLAYGAGSVAGGAPMAMAIPGLGAETALGRVAAGGLTGAGLGAVSGAGHADGRDLGSSVGKSAALGAALGTGGAAAREAAPYVKNAVMSSMAELPELEPASGVVARPPGARQAMLPPRPSAAEAPTEAFVPKAAKPLNAAKLNGEGRASQAAERPTLPEKVDPKQAYRDAAHRNRQAPPARGPQATGDDSTPTGMVPPPPRPAGGYKNTAVTAPTVAAPSPFAETVPAPASGVPTVPAPAPVRGDSMRPTMPDLAPVRPTLRPGSDDEYKQAVLREIAESARRNSY